MAKNKISDLRDHLFAALEGLSDEKNPMDIERAKAIALVSQTVINTAKLEVDMVKATDRLTASTFFQMAEHLPAPKQLEGSKTPTV
jgi:hypothetical protein